MYNEERKQQYLSEKQNRAIMSNNLANAMVLAEEKEKSLDRDMCEWNQDEAIDFFKYLSSNSVQTLVQLKNSIEGYVDWCQTNGLVRDNQNHWRDVTTEMLCDCINFPAFKRNVSTREEFLKNIRTIPNYRDRFLYLGLFEGIRSSHITKIKLSDLVQDILVLPDGNKITISRELVNIMHDANDEENCVLLKFGKEDRTSPYVAGDEILKDTVGFRKKSRILDGNALISRRLFVCNEYMGVSYTVKSIQESGRLEMIRELAKEMNIEPEKFLDNPELRSIHEYRYGELQQVMTYKLTYGRLLGDI